MNESSELSKEDYEKLKCSLCDEHLKHRYFELREILNKIFKPYLKLFRNAKSNDLQTALNWENDINLTIKAYLTQKSILDKMISFRKAYKSLDYQETMKV